MSTDEAYISGLEDMYGIVKAIFELTPEQRQERFDEALVANILDKFDFQMVRERMVERLEKRYIIRGITTIDYRQKKVAAESDPLTFEPDELLINAFLNCHKDKHIEFAVVEEVWMRENK